MSKIIVWLVLIVCACAVAAVAQNKVIFDNQSGEPALVKLVGPTPKEVEVPTGAKVGTDASAGQYIIKIRYGTPGKYHYSKGEEFDVKEMATKRSETTITLHKVVAGNYDVGPISEEEFGKSTPPTSGDSTQVIFAKSEDDKINGILFHFKPPQFKSLKDDTDVDMEQVDPETVAILVKTGIEMGMNRPEYGIYDKDPEKGGKLIAVGYGAAKDSMTPPIFRSGTPGEVFSNLGKYAQFDFSKGAFYAVAAVNTEAKQRTLSLRLLKAAPQEILSCKELMLGTPPKRFQEMRCTPPALLQTGEFPAKSLVDPAVAIFVREHLLMPEWGLYEIKIDGGIGDLIAKGNLDRATGKIRYKFMSNAGDLARGVYESDGKGHVKAIS